MIHNLAQPFTYSFLSASGEEIQGLVPTCKIKNVDKDLYFDGIDWQPESIEIAMNHISSGIYQYTIMFEEKGNYLISASDIVEDQIDEVELEIVAGPVAGLSNIHLHQKTMAQDKVVKLSIERKSDGYFYNGATWQLTEVQMTMTQVSPGVYNYTFAYPSEETFIFRTTEETTSLDELTEVNFRANITELPPNLLGTAISDATIMGTEGISSTVLDIQRMPLKGVDILAYNKATKEFYKTKTDGKGRWRLMVAPATYIIIFKKEAYTHTSIERVVS